MMLLALVLAGCGGSADDSKEEEPTAKTAKTANREPAKPAKKPALTIRTEGTPEEIVLTQIYAQALEGAGYRVRKNPHLSFEASTKADALKFGQISGYPEHLSTALSLGVEFDGVPPGTRGAYKKLEEKLEREELTAFPPTPFSLNYAVGMLRKRAENRGLKTDSDLKGKSKEMSLKGPGDCHVRLDCLGGLEKHYGVTFTGFSAVDPSRRYVVLERENVDSSILLTTDGRLSAERGKFVILEDDKHVLPANNAVWVTTSKLVEEAGPQYEKAIVEAQKGLTLKVMQELDAQVELEKRPPAKVAAQYLKSIGYSG